MTMGDKLFYMVYSNPIEGREDEFNEWYDTVHIPEVLATPGMVSAQRCDLKVTETSTMAGSEMSPDKHRYCVIYELDRDPDEVMGVITEKVLNGEMHMSDALDLTTAQMIWWAPRGEMQRAPGR
jgi:hypothetical protein